MHSPRYHRVRAASAKNGYKRACGPPTAASDQKQKQRAQSAAPSRLHSGSYVNPQDGAGIPFRDTVPALPHGGSASPGYIAPQTPGTSRPSSTSSSSTSCYPSRDGGGGMTSPRPPATPRPYERPRPSTGLSFRNDSAAGPPEPQMGSPRRSSSARATSETRSAPKAVPALKIGCGHQACRDIQCQGCHQAQQHDEIPPDSFIVDFDVCTELNRRICELSARLAREEDEKRKKPRVPRTAKTMMEAVDKQFGDRWEQEKQISQQLRKDLEAKESAMQRQTRMLQKLQATLQTKDKVSAGLMKQTVEWKGIIRKLDNALIKAKKDVEHAKVAQLDAETKLEQYRNTYRPQAAAYLHSQYLLSNKEVERELATRDIKRLEGELLKERHHSEKMELAAIAAANSRRDAEDHAAEAYGKVNDTTDRLDDIKHRLKIESQRGQDLSRRVQDLGAKLSTSEECLQVTQSDLVRQSSMREAAELQCKELSEALEVEKQMHESALVQLNEEREELHYVLQDRKILLDKIDVLTKNNALQKMAAGEGPHVPFTKKTVDSYYRMLRDTYEQERTRKDGTYLMK